MHFFGEISVGNFDRFFDICNLREQLFEIAVVSRIVSVALNKIPEDGIT